MAEPIEVTERRRVPRRWPSARVLRELVTALLLATAAVLIAVGAAVLHPAAGWIVAGVLVAAWTLVVFGDIGP